jgi:hypothetical protein
MRKRDVELITALAEGLLEDEAAARELIERSPRMRAAYEEQVRAREALGSLPDAAMTEAESAGLHRDLWTALATPGAEPRPAAGSAMRWGFAAAGLLVVVGVLAVIGQLGTSQSDTADAGEDQGQEMAVQDTVSTVAEPAGVVSPVATTAGEGSVPEEQELAAFATQARSGSANFQELGDMAQDDADTAEACVASAGLAGHQLVGEIERDGVRYAVAVPEGESLETSTAIVFVDLETCEVAYTSYQQAGDDGG